MNSIAAQFGEENFLYGLFIILIILSLILDFGILQRIQKKISTKSALIQTLCWIALALFYGFAINHFKGKEATIQYISGYLMEYSLSLDNVFVFIILLTHFRISEKYYHKVLFYGIIGAIVFRVIFIFLGILIVHKFHFVLYIFGGILIWTGYTMLTSGRESDFKPEENFMFKLLNRYFPLASDEGDGSFAIIKDGKKYYTLIFLVMAIIAGTDLVFALDSIPAVFAITQDRLIIMSSNIFAVMGLRAMFFLLSGVVGKFKYLKEGISLVLIMVGFKMLLEIFKIDVPTLWSLLVTLAILVISIMVSILKNKKTDKKIPFFLI